MTSLSRRSFLMTGAAASGLVMIHPFSARAAAGQAHLRLLSTTDLHCHVQPYDYYADKPSDTLGLARTATLIEAVRAEATNAILFDNGDYLQGNPMGDYIAYSKGMKDGDIHPVIAGMNTLNYAAGTLGNHEFNYGIDFLTKVNAGANFPIVCANFAKSLGATPREDILFAKPYVILETTLTDGAGESHPLRLGVIGFVPPQIMQWDRAHLEGSFQTRDILEAARAWMPQLREEGVDLVVALAHTGIDAGAEGEMMENAAFHLAAVEGIDAIISGHQHKVWPSKDYAGDGFDMDTGLINGKPVVMAGFWGSHMGMIDLMLERDGTAWRLATAQSSVRPIYERGADRKVTALVSDYAPVIDATAQTHEETLGYVRAEVGKTDAPLYSYFALLADDPSVQIVSQAQIWYVAEQLKGTEHEGLPILSAAAPFKAGGRGGPDYYTDVAVGPVAIKNVADLYLYPNTLQAVRITGAEVREWLERSAGMFNQIAPGAQDAALLNPDFPSYNFDTIDGVTYRIDLSQPIRYDNDGKVVEPDSHRIVDLKFNGQPIDDAQEFIVASNNYRASGGGHFPGADGSTVILQAPDTNRDVIVRYIVEKGTIEPKADGNWSFAALPGTTVLYETSPKAAAYLDDIRARGITIEAAGEGEGGFAKYRVSL